MCVLRGRSDLLTCVDSIYSRQTGDRLDDYGGDDDDDYATATRTRTLQRQELHIGDAGGENLILQIVYNSLLTGHFHFSSTLRC